ncbi:sensor histidine kinase [bacterium]|nr:sensor histidine kinase [bacterium]
MPHAPQPNRHPSLWPVVLAAGLGGALLNCLPVPLMPGVHSLFGTTLAFAVALNFGPVPGMLAAAIALLPTIVIWLHPYAIFPMTIEVGAVAWLSRRWPPLSAILLYWLLFGWVFNWGYYRFYLGWDPNILVPLLLKQMLNSWLNVLFALLLLTFWPRREPWTRWLALSPGRLPLKRVLQLVLMAVAAVPIFLAGSLYGRSLWEREEERQRALQSAELAMLSQGGQGYLKEHQDAVRTVAVLLSRADLSRSEEQFLLEATHRSVPGFVNLYIGSPKGKALLFYPPLGPGGTNPIGQDFSDRPYFHALRAGRSAVVSDVFLGRGGTAEPIVVLGEPIHRAGRFAGYVSGAVDLAHLANGMGHPGPYTAINLVDASGRYVATSHGASWTLKPARIPFDYRSQAGITQTEYVPELTRMSIAQAFERQLVSYTTLPGLGWILWIETSVLAVQERMQASYLGILGGMVLGVLAAFGLSVLLARVLSRPLLVLAQDSQAFARGDAHALRGEALPAVEELAGLTTNLREMAAIVRMKQEELAEQVRARTLELEEANERLLELDRLKGEFLNSASHELRTPLASIVGYSEFLEDEIGGPITPQQREFIHQIQAGSARLRRIVDDMLDFARLEAGTFSLQRADVELGGIIQDAVRMLQPQAREAHLTLEATPLVPPLTLSIDAQRIGQVLLNLMGNSLKFTPAGGRITVSAKRLDGEVRVEVCDTGIGIAPEHQRALFRKFYQVDSSSTRAHGGAGLGLAISKALVEAHGGRIGLESAPGEGSVFWFTLPIVQT